MKMVDKASKFSTYKNIAKDELGDCAKYVDIITKDSAGKTIKPIIDLNKSKIDEDLKYAGYNLLVTSEIDMEPLQVYKNIPLAYGKSRNLLDLQNHTWMLGLFIYRKKKQSMGIF